MRKVVCIQIISFLLLNLASVTASAQDYVLTVRGDSLTGEVKPLLYGPEKKVQIISSADERTTFNILEVRAFSSEGDIFHPVRSEKGYEFMKLVKPGYLSLYAYQLEDQTRFDGLFLKKMDGDWLAVPNLGFKKYMSRFLEDCPSVAGQLENGQLGKKNLHEIIDAYNTCVENRTLAHSKVLLTRGERATKANAWSELEEKVRGKEFPEKNNALEMIAEIQKKIQRHESIPNFLLQGLKNSLRDTGLSSELDHALEQVN